jgi:hypothetical protein
MLYNWLLKHFKLRHQFISSRQIQNFDPVIQSQEMVQTIYLLLKSQETIILWLFLFLLVSYAEPTVMTELYSIHEYMDTVKERSVLHENYRATARCLILPLNQDLVHTQQDTMFQKPLHIQVCLNYIQT